jgi:hypothetical protein
MSDRGQAGHEQTHGMAKQNLRLAFFLTMIILAAELIGGFLSNSLALQGSGIIGRETSDLERMVCFLLSRDLSPLFTLVASC